MPLLSSGGRSFWSTKHACWWFRLLSRCTNKATRSRRQPLIPRPRTYTSLAIARHPKTKPACGSADPCIAYKLSPILSTSANWGILYPIGLPDAGLSQDPDSSLPEYPPPHFAGTPQCFQLLYSSDCCP